MRFNAAIFSLLLGYVVASKSSDGIAFGTIQDEPLLRGGSSPIIHPDISEGPKKNPMSLADKLRHHKMDSSVFAKHSSRDSIQVSFPPNRLLNDPAEAVPTGLWSSRGYGYALNIIDETTALFMYETSISCIVVDTEFMPAEYDLTVQFVPNDDSILILKDGKTELVFDRVDTFPGFCAQGITPTVLTPDDYVRNPLNDFDILVQTFIEHYAFFDLRRQPNWTELTNTTRTNLSSNSTDEDLILALAEILEPLQDGHVSVSSGGIQVVTSDEISIQTQFNADFANQTTVSDPDEYFVLQLFAWWEILASYMNEGLRGETGVLLYGTLAESPRTGYLQLISFDPEDEVTFYNLLSVAMQYLKEETDSLVLDIRINFGGKDELALFVASYFASESTLAFSKRARMGNGYTARQEIYLDPFDDPLQRYTGPVVLVTSQSTVSAGEIFTMTMKELPHVVHYGEITMGILSDVLQHVMPIGFVFGLSNEEYAAADGTLYEAIGLGPDILAETPLLPLTERQAGIDSWLTEAVIIAEDLATQSVSPTSRPTASNTETPSESPSGGSTLSVVRTIMLLLGGAALSCLA